MSIQVVDLEASMKLSLVKSQGHCRGSDMPPIDLSRTLSGLVRSIQPAADGSFRASWEGPGQRYSLIIRRSESEGVGLS
jgi:hypothetical protein